MLQATLLSLIFFSLVISSDKNITMAWFVLTLALVFKAGGDAGLDLGFWYVRPDLTKRTRKTRESSSSSKSACTIWRSNHISFYFPWKFEESHQMLLWSDQFRTKSDTNKIHKVVGQLYLSHFRSSNTTLQLKIKFTLVDKMCIDMFQLSFPVTWYNATKCHQLYTVLHILVLIVTYCNNKL